MKAIEKDRARRYGTPSELAADIQRYLRHEPVIAPPCHLTACESTSVVTASEWVWLQPSLSRWLP